MTSKSELHARIRAREWPDLRCQAREKTCESRDLGPVVAKHKELTLPAWRSWAGAVHIHGHSFLPAAPTLLTGPSVINITTTTARAIWTVDLASYHRVRYKLGILGAWQYTPWTAAPPSTSAAVDLSGLAPEHSAYYIDVQSCIVGDGSAAFAFAPGDDSVYFWTLCSGVYGYANLAASKVGMPPFQYLTLSWTTSVAMNQLQIFNSPFAYGPATAVGTSHSRDYTTFKFLPGTYSFKVKNRNLCNVWGPYSYTHYFSCNAGGDIDFQWDV